MSNELQQDTVVEVGAEYQRTHWENNKTPLNAANLNNIENGIEQNREAIIKETNDRASADIAINTELDAFEKKTGFIYDEKNGKISFNLPELLTILGSEDLSDLQKGAGVEELLENYTLSQMFMMLYTMYTREVGDMYSSETSSDGKKIYKNTISDGLENRMNQKTLISAINNLYFWVRNTIGIDDYAFEQGYSDAKDKFADIHSDLSSLSSVVQIFNKIYEFVRNNKSSIELLNSSEDVQGSVKNTVITEIAKVVAGAPDDLNTLKEIADWIESHPDTVAAINSSIKDNADAIAEIKDNYVTETELADEISKVSQNIDISKFISYGNDYPSGDITTPYYVKLNDTEVAVKSVESGYSVDLKIDSNTVECEYYREGNMVIINGRTPLDSEAIAGLSSKTIYLYHHGTNTPFYSPVIETIFNISGSIKSYKCKYTKSSTIIPDTTLTSTLPDNTQFTLTFYTSDEMINNKS